jgi:serine/threonine protein kinase/tetratricopeptide (TPR) repeat protein
MEKLHEQPDDPLLGCTLPGGHVVLELIDVGGMGRVYRAEQKMLGRTVAVKIIHPHLLGDETVEARFITEARAASQLNHPNSVGVIDFGKFEGRLYMVMEYLRGRDLATVAHEEGPLELDRIIDIMNQTLAALEEAHHVGIIHRDLKPENIVLSPLRSGGDFVKVLDFGLAKVLQIAQIASNRRITDPGMVCGTPEYMAPEQARGDDIDHRADLYACGVLLYELLAGTLPFEGASPREVVLLHLSQLPPDITIMAPDRKMPQALVDLVMKALSKDPADRFQSASAYAEALNKAMGPTRTRSQSLIQCPSCDAMMPLRQKFCGECGSAMTMALPESRPSEDISSQVEDDAGPRFPLKFVGRDDELGRLFELRDAASSSLVAARLVGYAGSGKTRLLDEFLVHAEKWGDVVVYASPDPWWSNKGYHALRETVRQLAELPSDGGSPSEWPGASPEARAGLDAIFERSGKGNDKHQRRRWSETPPLGPAEGSGSRRALAAEALRWAIGRAQERADDARVIIAIDDLHSVDGASRNAFADVVIEPPLDAVLLLGAQAPDFDAGWEGAEQVDVKGLPTTTAVKLLGGEEDGDGMRRAAESEAPPAPNAAVNDSGSSNGRTKRVSPMYVEQLTRFSQEGGEDPPPKLADLIALRIERLPADARRALQAVAILGDATGLEHLESVLPDVKAANHIAQLEEEGFLRTIDDRLSTTHPLVRDVCLASMPAAVRTTLHSRALMARTNGAGPPLEAEANHAYHAGASFEALMLLERVADRARERDDVGGMVSALHRALELARREMMVGELDDPVAAVLMFSCKLGDALAAVGKRTDADGVLTEALDLAGPISPERSRILVSLANVARGRGRADAAYQRLDEAVRIAEKANHHDLLAMLERTRRLWIQGLP